MRKKFVAYIVNFLVVGSGFSLYGKSLIGFAYLIPYIIVWGLHEQIGAIWALIILIVSFVHLSKVISHADQPKPKKSAKLIDTIDSIYHKVREMYPGKKEAFYLSLTLFIYIKKTQTGDKLTGDSFELGAMMTSLSQMESKDAVKGLSLYLIEKIFPKELSDYQSSLEGFTGKLNTNLISNLVADKKEAEETHNQMRQAGDIVKGMSLNDF